MAESRELIYLVKIQILIMTHVSHYSKSGYICNIYIYNKNVPKTTPLILISILLSHFPK